MITFEPDSPWEVGQVVTFREEGRLDYRKVVVWVEHSEDGHESRYTLQDTLPAVVAVEGNQPT